MTKVMTTIKRKGSKNLLNFRLLLIFIPLWKWPMKYIKITLWILETSPYPEACDQNMDKEETS
jgi:hypothetical protein